MAIGKKTPASRSDIAKLRKEREEKKREEQEAKKKAAEPKPNLGTEGKKKPKKDDTFFEDNRPKSAGTGTVRAKDIAPVVEGAKDFGSKLMTSIKDIGKAAVAPDEENIGSAEKGSQGLPTNPFAPGSMSADDQDTMTGISDIGEYYAKKYGPALKENSIRAGQAAIKAINSPIGAAAMLPTGPLGRSLVATDLASKGVKAMSPGGPLDVRKDAIQKKKGMDYRERQRVNERSDNRKAELDAAYADPDMKEAFKMYLGRMKTQGMNENMYTFDSDEEREVAYKEFVQDMTNISPTGSYTEGDYQQDGPTVSGAELRARLEGKGEKQVTYEDEDPYDNVPPVKKEVMVKPRTNLNVKDFPSGSRDESNEARIRNIKARRAAEGKTDLDDGMSRGANATGVDPATGLPVVKGNIVRDDGVNISRQRRAPNASTVQVLQDPNLSPVDKAMYFAQEMGLDFDKIAPEQHVDAAITFYQAHSPAALAKDGYVISGDQSFKNEDGDFVDMSGADFDPESLDVLRGTKIREDGDQGTTITGSAPRTYVPGKELLAKRENRKNYQNFLRQTRSHNASKDFQNDDGGVFTNKYRLEDGSFDVESFSAENPGIIPVDEEGNINPDDPMTRQRIRRVEDAIDRGTAVKQQNINRGYMQNLQSPTLNPILMKQSLDQTDDLREKAAIALGYGNRELADMYLQMDADDTALLMEEEKAKAARENEETNFETPGATTKYLSGQMASGDMTTGQVINALTASGNMTEPQAKKATVSMLVGAKPPVAVMAEPIVQEALGSLITPMRSFLDPVRGSSLAATPEQVRDKFIKDAMTTYGFTADYQPFLFEYWNKWQRGNEYEGEIPGEQKPQRTTEDQQPEGVQPPAGMN